jgi:hypothetical protein
MHRMLMTGWREIFDVFRGATPTHHRLRARIFVLIVTTLIIDLLLSVAIWRLERGTAQTEIHGYGDAVFWTSSQLLTVSSSMKNPLSTGGRVLDVFMELYAITVVATLAGSFSAFLHARGRERDAEAEVASAAPAPRPG